MSKKPFNGVDAYIEELRAKGLNPVVNGVALPPVPPSGRAATPERVPQTPTTGEPLDVKFLVSQLTAHGYAAPVPEHYFHPLRKWRFDLAWPCVKVAFEREGGRYAPVTCQGCGTVRTVFVSRHHSREGMEEDADKYNSAALLGWIVIRATPPMLKDGRAASSLIQALQLRKAPTA